MADKTKTLLQNLVTRLQSEDRSMRVTAMSMALQTSSLSSPRQIDEQIKDAEKIYAFLIGGTAGE